ncbi:GNAT family N-acetyltransferase [Rhodoluna limnophila]|uniref:GNAT family N-acetyltransferase n=1 Tax=Rhodoluna limnophila TaxID=232537 RepID=UPI0011060A0D|nr:GNAT family N-acetyltransferase [Rhodoluna limnophila]
MALDSESRWRLVRLKKAKGDVPEPNEISIQAATLQDIPQCAEIYNYYIRNSVVTFDEDSMTLEQWREKFTWLTSLGMPFLVAKSAGGQTLGFAYVGPWRQKAAYRKTVEDSIYLRPAAIGKRVGTKLLSELIEQSRAAGVKEIVAVISDKGAESSIALHERFGFKHQGHLGKVGFKFGRWLGTILMQKSL